MHLADHSMHSRRRFDSHISAVEQPLRCGVQKVQDIMLAEVQGPVQGGAGRCRAVQRGAGRCRGGAGRCREVQGWLHHLHLGKHNIRCREVQAVQAHLRFVRDPSFVPERSVKKLRTERKIEFPPDS